MERIIPTSMIIPALLLSLLLLRPKLPKNKFLRKTSARMVIKPTSTTTTVESSMSRLPTCESSCASTPSSSGFSNMSRSPVVTATTACSLLRPVAKAFGAGSLIIYTFGIGNPAVMERFSTLVYKTKFSSRLAGFAPANLSTILSENQ